MNNAGVASFDSTDFDGAADANGFVSLTATAGPTQMQVDTFTAPGTYPVMPNGSGIITVTGGQVAAGSTTCCAVIRTDSLAAYTYTILIQRSQAVASSTIGDNGVSHFNSTYFTVDANGFVSLNGSSVGETITGNSGGALSPTSGNWNIFGAAVAAGTTPVATSGTGSTLTVNVQRAQAIASTNATNAGAAGGLAAFNSTYFTVDGYGFVSLSGSTVGQTITGDTGGALSPTAGNWFIFGSSTAAGTAAPPVQTAGSGSTLTVQVQKALAIASTNATNVDLSAFNCTYFTVDASCGGFVSVSGTGILASLNGDTGTATPTAGAINVYGNTSPAATGLTFTGSASASPLSLGGTLNVSHGGTAAASPSFTANGAVISNTTSTGALAAVALASQQFLVGTSGAPIAKRLSINTQVFTSNGTSAPI